MDNRTSEQRSTLMSRVKAKNTRPEIAVRRFLHGMGIRFRLHRADLPGRPDIVLPKHRTAVFVHGCFWHRHPGCPRTTTPADRRDFWIAKFAANQRRDRKAIVRLRKAGWKVIVVWECETKKPELLVDHFRTLIASDDSCDSHRTVRRNRRISDRGRRSGNQNRLGE